MRLIAGVDSSTQSCKVELRSADDFALLATGTAPHPETTPPVSEQDPEAWWAAFVAAFASACAQVPGGVVEAISVAGQCHGLVPLDREGQVIRPAKLWNDTTSAAELAAVVSRIGQRELIDRTGSLPTAAFTLGKVAWLAAHEPENLGRTAMMLLPHDYLTFRLTGRYVTDRSEASGTGYYDAASGRYLPDFLSAAAGDRPWVELVPDVEGPDDAVGEVLAGPMRELGLRGSVLVGAGGGDQHASAVGLGLQSGGVVFALGTSGVVFATTPDPVRDPSGTINGVAAMQGGFLPLACTLNAARVTDTFARILGVDHAELSRLALAATGDGPTLAAFLDGERTPNRPGAAGLLADLRTDTSRESLARAAYEGVIFGLVGGAHRLAALDVDVGGAVLSVGGGSRAEAYNQFLADALGREVSVADAPEAVARGAALQAWAVTRGVSLTQAMSELKPASRVVATPRGGADARLARYLEVASVTHLDR